MSILIHGLLQQTSQSRPAVRWIPTAGRGLETSTCPDYPPRLTFRRADGLYRM